MWALKVKVYSIQPIKQGNMADKGRTKRGRKTTGPWAAAVITDGVSRRTVLKAISEGADIMEARVDTFPSLEAGQIADSLINLKKISKLPLLLTIRSASEGGSRHIPDKKRAELFASLMPLADLVDIELGSSRIIKTVVNSAKRHNKTLVVSYHNFKSTPGAEKLSKIVELGRAKGADIVKVATFVNSPGDLRRLARLLVENEGLAVIGMGGLGASTRVFFPLLGSAITYGSVTTATAPGQMTLKELGKELARYGFTD